MSEYKLIISGECDFFNYPLLKDSVNAFITNVKRRYEIVIVSDLTTGASMLGEQYAAEMGYEVAEFGNGRDCINTVASDKLTGMFDYSDGCIAFWNGKSNNVKKLIALAKAAKLKLAIVRF